MMFADGYAHGYAGFASLSFASLPAANTNSTLGAFAIASATICPKRYPPKLPLTTFMPFCAA